LTTADVKLQELAINSIRLLALDAVQKANSGHPGLPMGAAAMAYTLWTRHLRHNPQNPHWANRDRFVLSAGHGSMLIYTLLYLSGYDLSLDELKNFRQWGSKTPGHPEYGHTPGVETTTGPLGQGGANAVGLALAEAFLASHFNRDGHEIVNHFTYALVSDGDMMEGVFNEAVALAGHWGLGKLIFMYDNNKVTLDGKADMTFTEDIPARFRAQGWHVLEVEDGNDVEAIDIALANAKANNKQPSLISIRTTIGFGSPNFAGSNKAHGAALGEEEVKLVKEGFGWPQEDFFVPGEALEFWRQSGEKGVQTEAKWNDKFAAWQAAFPDLAADWDRAMDGELPAGWDADIPVYGDAKQLATRNASGEVLNAIAKHIPTMIGGDADLAGSTKTLLNGEDYTGHLNPAARNLRFGVREHAMGAIANGLALHGGIIKPYTATFLTFSDYMRPAIRLGGLMNTSTVYVFTHDSIGLGEDGPTHQPIEHVMSLRLIPGVHVFRPADANETAAAWHTAMTLEAPVVLIFTRQNLPVLTGDQVREGVNRGGYVLVDSAGAEDPEVILIGSGSEVHIAHEASKILTADGIKTRVVSLPCWELFQAQSDDYKESVLPSSVTARVSIEAGVTLGWDRFVGSKGESIGVDRFGASAPYQQLYEAFGLTPKAVVEAAHRVMRT
jgi:transketolase